MLKNKGWLQLFIAALYISLQSLFWLNALHFFYRRFEIPLLPAESIFWLVLMAIIVLLPLPYLAAPQRHIWFGVTAIAGIVSGYLMFDYIGTIVILAVGVTWFSLKKIVDGIGAREFIFSLMSIMILFGISFIFSYFYTIEPAEVSSLTQFFLLSFVITIIGMVVAQLSNYDGFIKRDNFLKQWGLYNGWVWGTLALLSLGSVVILLALSQILPLVGWLLKAILMPIATFVFNVILPWLQDTLRRLIEEVPVEDESDQIWGEDEFIIPDTITPMSPLATLLWNIVLYSILFALLVFIAYKFYKYVQKNVKKKGEETDSSQRDPIIVQSLTASNHHTSWQDKLRGLFRPYTGREEHLIRKEYRNMLKLMKKKGIWKSDAMTVQQLNQLVHASEYSSSLYERLRYGDQDLSDEEIVYYRDEIQKLMGEIKK